MAKNYYSSVDKAPMGKSKTTKKKKSKKKIPSGVIDQTMAPKSNKLKKKSKKKYTGTFKTRQPEIEWANVRRSQGLSFGDAFKKHKAAGDKEFTWRDNKYTTRTKEELETGKSEKERFERKGKSNIEAAKSKKTLREKVTGYSTQKGYDEAKSERIKAKRIAKIEARKAAGKSYSKKNLAALKA